MSLFRSKPDNRDLFDRAASEQRLSRRLAATCSGVSHVRAILPYLLEDDRISGEYIDSAAATAESGSEGVCRLLTGGYFRFYDPSEDMIYLSPFKRAEQQGLAAMLGKHKQVKYLSWRVGAIVKLYIKHKVEERIRRTCLGERRRSGATFGVATPARAAGMPRSASAVSLPDI